MSKKKAASILSPEDEKQIAAGEFFITEIETLRLQRLDALSGLWNERANSAQAKAQLYGAQLRAEIDALKIAYGLSDGHGVDLGDNVRGRIFVSTPQPGAVKE